MQDISEYQQHAIECRKLAAEMNDPIPKKQMEVMAGLWEVLALELAKCESVNG